MWRGAEGAPRARLRQEREKGGLNLRSMGEKNASAILLWIARYNEDPNQQWAKFLKEDLKRLGGTCAVRGNIDNELIGCVKWNTTKDILSNLILITSNPEVLNSKNIKEITPWLNQEVKNKENKILPHNLPLIKKGFVTLKDFFHQGKIMNWGELDRKNLNDNEKMAYYTVTHSIKKEWKTLFESSYLLHNPNNTGENTIEVNKFYLNKKNEWEEISALGLRIFFKETMGKIPLPESPFMMKINNFYPVSHEQWEKNFKIIKK